MADPTVYAPGYDFVGTDKGADLNAELQNIQSSIASVVSALADVRRSDGRLQNQVVTVDALNPLSIASLGSLSEGLEAQVEDALADAGAAAVAADTARVAAIAAQVGAVTAAEQATAAAVSATASASTAADAATTATGAATTATSAATAASGSATAAATSATNAAATLANSRFAFSARKSADQTGIVAATPTKITFPTEVLDFGGYYDAANSRYTPPSGRYRLTAGLAWSAGLVDARQVTVEIRKNGAVFRVYGVQVSGTTDSALVSGSCLVEANGTDYFEVYGTGFGTGDKTVALTTTMTFFEGEAI